jgi:hypothetical protein
MAVDRQYFCFAYSDHILLLIAGASVQLLRTVAIFRALMSVTYVCVITSDRIFNFRYLLVYEYKFWLDIL